MRTDLVAWTQVDAQRISLAVGGFDPDPFANDAEHLIETAGRLCYGSFARPNKKTAENANYIRHILEVGHGSVLEHATATFIVQDVSRSLTHELIRSRHLSYSQRSQRYVDEGGAEFVVPPAVAGSSLASEVFERSTLEAKLKYAQLVAVLTAELPAASRKEIRQAARSVLPNSTATAIVTTGNYRAWRHFISLRATKHADIEIREFALECLRQLQGAAPAVFSDFRLVQLEDGTQAAESDYGSNGSV